MPPKLTKEIIDAAIDGFENQKKRLDQQIAELRALLTDSPGEASATPEAPAGKRKKFSAAAKKRMALAQKARWAKLKGKAESEPTAKLEPAKPKRQISQEGMARIIAATKKRWAKVRAAKKKGAA